jgi:acetyltransferase-like isoleucine patch superfamily enzyme
VLAGAVLSSSVRVGEFCILNTRSSIDHDSKLSNYSFIGPGATLCGSVLVGEESFVGAGATVIQGKQIASKSLIGAGSLVTKNIFSNTLAYGVPAIPVRSRSDHERYF